MECKESFYFFYCSFLCIGIYPEWNVKRDEVATIYIGVGIGIYPEWNVKSLIGTRFVPASILEYIQNGM